MAVVQLNKGSAGGIQSQIKRMENEIEASTQKVNSAINGLDFEVAARENIRARLYSIKKSLNKQETLAVRYREVFINVSNDLIDTDGKFGSQSESIADMIKDFLNVDSGNINDFFTKNKIWKYAALATLFMNGNGLLAITYLANSDGSDEPSWLAKFINNKYKVDGDVLKGEKSAEGDLWGIGTAGVVAGTVLHGEAGIKTKGSLSFKDENGNWDFKKAGVSAKASASGSVVAGEAKGNIGYLHGEASGEALTGGVAGEAKATLYEDGKFNPSLYVGGSAEVSALHGEAEAGFGTEQFGIDVGASGDVGHAEAEAGFGLGYIGTDEDGNAQYGAKVEASAMASAAEGKVEGGVTLFGIDIDVGVKGYAGAIGVEGGASISTDGATGSFGGALLFGGKLDVSIDWSDAEWIGDTVDAVGDFTADAVDFVGDVADGAAKATGEFFDDVGDFFSSNFNWF